MKKNNKLTAFAVIAALSTQAISGTAFAISDAQRIAEENKENIVRKQKEVIMELIKVRQQLALVKTELQVKEDLDYSGIASGINVATSIASAGLFTLSALALMKARGGDQVVGGLVGTYGAGVLVLSHLMSFVDKLFTPDPSYTEITEGSNSILASLGELKNNLESKKDKQTIQVLMDDVAEINSAITLEDKKDKSKAFLVKSSLVLSALAITSGFLTRNKEVGWSFETSILAISAALSAASAMSGGDKEEVLRKMTIAIESLDSTISILRADL